MSDQPITIAPMQISHAGAVARIHIISQEGTFLTALGREFLTVLYQQFSQSKFGVNYVALADDAVVGFITGTLSTGEIFKETALKRPLKLTWLVLKRAATQPSLLWQAVKTLAYPAQAGHNLPPAELLSLAVDIAWRNHHIGTKLLLQLKDGMRAIDVMEMAVTVDAENHGALRFYRRHGFIDAFTEEMYGREMAHLVWDLTEGN